MTTTMISNWPDAIRCGDGTRDSGAVFMLHAAGSNTGDISWYVQVFSEEYRYVNFKSDGSYNTKGGYDGSSRGCLGQSIKQLYDAGKAFNFVSFKTIATTQDNNNDNTNNDNKTITNCDFRGATIIGSPTITCTQNIITYKITGNATLKELKKSDKIDVSLYDCIDESLDKACEITKLSCIINLVDKSTDGAIQKTAKLILEEIPIVDKISDIVGLFFGDAIEKACSSAENLTSSGALLAFATMLLFE